MQSFFFWRTWTREYKVFWFILIVLFLSSLVFMWSGYFRVPQGLTDWHTQQVQKTVEGVTHTFEAGNFEFAVPIESYSTLEYFYAGPLKIDIISSYIFVAVLAFMSILIFAVITTFSRFWYYVGTGLLVLFIVSMRLDVLELFGQRNFIATIITVVVFGSVSFYFNAFNTAASFTVRVLSFLLLTTGLGVIIHFFSAVEHPFLYMSVSSFIPALILTVIFIFMIAHEIIAGFVYLTSQSSTSSKSLQHFMIISLIYIVNLVLTYMNEAGLIEWNFVFINLYLLVTISAVLAIWGYRRRESLYDSIVSFYPFGAYFIVALGVIAFTSIGVFLHTYNDAVLKIIRDVIIFSHIGFGVIFLLYFTSNFIGMMAANRNVYKVLYNPTSMPYATYRIAGLIATFAFIFYSQWHTYVYNGTAGIFNMMGDVQHATGEDENAESYYRQARLYAGNNFHGNYILAGIETRKNDFKTAHLHYNTINWTKPTESSLINNANLYLFENDFFTTKTALQEAQKEFPESGIINTNLGYAFLKIGQADTAFIFFDQARSDNTSKASSDINITGLLAQTGVSVNVDSILQRYGTSSKAVLSNSILIAAHDNQPIKTAFDPLKDPVLDLHSATLLNNYIVYKLKELDTTFINKALKIASDSLNTDYSEALKATLSHAYYYQNNVAKAMSLMGLVAFITQSMQGKFNYTMGLWALEQGNPELALRCFAYSVEQDFKEAKIYNAIALAEAGMSEEANAAANSLLESKAQSDKEIGKQLKKLYSISASDILSQTDLEKYQYCRYRINLTDSILFKRILTTIENTNYKTLIILEMAQRQFNAGKTLAAIRYFNTLDGIQFTDKKLNDRLNHFELELLASRNEVRLIASKINEGITFPQDKQLQKLLYTALINEASGDTLAAQKNYEILSVYNPFFEEGVIAASRYFKNHSTDRFKAYTILAEAKQVNPGSARLIMAYIAEATRVGFDDFAADAYEELEIVRARKK
jgi:hypothetical protein